MTLARSLSTDGSRVEQASGELLLIMSVLGSRETRKKIHRELERRAAATIVARVRAA